MDFENYKKTYCNVEIMEFTLQGYVQVRKNIKTIIIVLSLKEDINNFLNYFYQILSIDNIFIYILILVCPLKN